MANGKTYADDYLDLFGSIWIYLDLWGTPNWDSIFQ